MSELDVAIDRSGERGRGRSLALSLARVRSHRELRHLVKYGIVGVTNVTLDFGLYVLLVSLGVWYPLAKTGSLVIATANGYTLNRLWTFRAGAHRNIVLTKYVTVVASCLGANLILLALLIEIGGMHQITAQAVVVPVLALSSFLAQRLWTFGHALR